MIVLRAGLAIGGLAGVAALPVPPPVPHQGTGTITGIVTLSSSLTTRRPRIRLYAEYGPGQSPRGTPTSPNELMNVVVYIDSAPTSGQPPAPGLRPSIRQEGESFLPHVLPVLVGTRVDFPNADPFFHNVFSLSQAKVFDLGRYPTGRSKAVLFDKPGIVQVFCHIHSDMSAVVVVRPNPYFAVPDSTGRFTISGAPPGTYRLVGWHQRATPVVHTISVGRDSTSQVNFNIPVIEQSTRDGP